MKKLFLSSLLILVFTSTTFAAYTVGIKFFWGTNADGAQGCPGYGLCGVEIVLPKQQTPNDDKSTNGYFILGDNNRLSVQFSLSEIPNRFSKDVINGKITVDNDYILSNDICNSLNLESYTIKKGAYQTKIEGDKFIIQF